MDEGQRRRRAPGNDHVDGNDIGCASTGNEARPENTAGKCTCAGGDYLFRGWHRVICLSEWHPHVVGDGTGDQQNVSLPRGRRDEEPQAVDIIVRVVELFDFAQACPASPGINYTDMQRGSKNVPRARDLHGGNRVGAQPTRSHPAIEQNPPRLERTENNGRIAGNPPGDRSPSRMSAWVGHLSTSTGHCFVERQATPRQSRRDARSRLVTVGIGCCDDSRPQSL